MAAPRIALLTLVLGLAAGFGVGLTASSSRPAHARAAAPVEQAGARIAAPAVAQPIALAAAPSAPRPAPRSAFEERIEARAEDLAESASASRTEVEATGEEASWTETLRGVVEDEEGRPIAGATVVADNEPSGERGPARGRSTRTVGRAWRGYDDLDDELAGEARSRLLRRARARIATTDELGRFELEGLREGRHRLRGYAEGYVVDGDTFEAGSEARLVARPVALFHLDLRLPDGSAPSEALVLTVDERRSRAYAWTPEEPVLRMEARTYQFHAMSGDPRNLDWQTYVAEYESERRTVNLDSDGEGPHVFQLAPTRLLRVTVEDRSGMTPVVRPHVTLVPAERYVDGEMPRDVRGLSRVEDGHYVAAPIEPGTYVVMAARGQGLPEAAKSVEVTDGPAEVELTLGPIEGDRFIVARCSDASGRPLSNVDFSYRMEWQGGGSSAGGVREVEREDGVYWLPSATFEPDQEQRQVGALTIKATARRLGSVTIDVPRGASELAFQFEPACEIAVQVAGDLSPGFSVSVGAVPEEGNPRYGFGGRSERVDSNGIARLTGLQPGRVRVSLVRTQDRRRWRPDTGPAAFVDVDVRPGTQTVRLTAPDYYELVVYAPELAEKGQIGIGPTPDDGRFRMTTNSRVGEDGRVRFEDLVAGEYTLQGWGGEVNGKMSVTVPSGEVRFEPEPEPDAKRSRRRAERR